MPTAKNEVRLLALSDEGKENVEAVCKLLTEQKVKNTWVSADKVLMTSESEDDVIYVVDPTEGKEVEYLVELGYSVIGPQCALTVLKHNILLKNNLNYPVYNLTMLGCLICFSNIEPKKRTELRYKVERMGGKVTGSLTQDVTHLVVKEVGSVKYFSAAHVGISIMVLDWIDHLWRHGQSRYISAKDGKWEEFKCPIFLGCSVCVTGFNTAERNRIQKLITKFAGTYSGAMKLDFTTHLVVHKPEGQKYMMANKFGVKVVNIDWVYKSVEKGSCQDHAKYPVKACEITSKPNSSTPERSGENGRMPSIHDMSNISVMTVDESVASSITDVSTLSSIGVPPFSSKNAKMDLLQFNVSKSLEQILDGISVYVAGFSMKEEEKLQVLLSTAGATRCNQLTSVVTHVLVGSSGSLSKNIKSSIQTAYNKSDSDLSVVSYKWLLDSLTKNEVLPESDYWTDEIVKRQHGPVSDFDPDLSTFVEAKNNRTTDADTTKHTVVQPHLDPDVTTVQDVVSEYVGGEDGDTTMLRNFDFENNQTNNNQDADVHDPEVEEDVDEAEVEDGNSSRWTFFRGLTFAVIGFDEENLNRCVDNIESLGGRILPSYSKKIADYAVVPVTGCQVDKTVTHIVTDFWVDSCLTEGNLVGADSHPLSTPFAIPNNASPLEGCVTCLSKYQEPERSHLVELMRDLGAFYQDNVARKDMPPLRRTTHLVVMVPEGDKYVGCNKWGIPTVTAEWVYECARQGKKLSESTYIVGLDEQSSILPDVPPIPTKCDVTGSSKSESTSLNDAENGINLEFPPMPRPPSAVDVIRRRLEAKRKIDHDQDRRTPFKEKVLRMMDTPSKLLRVDSSDNVSFQLDEVFALLKTPLHERERIKASVINNPDTPLSACVERFLTDAIKDIPENDDSLVKNLEKIFENGSFEQDPDPIEVEENENVADAKEIPLNEDAKKVDDKILKGVVVYVCKKLTKQRMECSDIVTELGGEFRWTYDKASTHFIFQGKPNDMNREFRTARSDGKLIVSPHWLSACKEARTRLDEEGFPHVYNPNKSIQILPSSSQTRSKRATRSTIQPQIPSRSTRSTSRTSPSESDDSKKQQSDSATLKASEEARESLKKTLETIISSTGKLTKSAPPRRSCNRSTDYSSPPHLALPTRGVREPTNDKPESSQDVHVTWDDPIGREAMEKIMKEQNGEIPSLNTDQESEAACEGSKDEEDTEESKEISNKKTDAEDSAFDDICLSQIMREGGIPSFLISSVTPEQKTDYAATIEQIGGLYLDRDYFDVKCTHLVVKKPARNEKFLASLASGKWILHTSYIEECREAKAFVKEDHHEYGNPLSSWKPANDTELLLSSAAYRWRRFLNKNRTPGVEIEGAFANWKVLLHVSQRHTPGFVRLLESGSGQVVAKSLSYKGNVSEITHAIIDQNRLKDVSRDFVTSLFEAGVHCCVPEYIADFLMKDPQPQVEDCYLSWLKDLVLTNEEEKPRKRRKVT